MRYYETLYIVNPNFEGERLDAVIKEVGDQIAGFEGVTVINHRVWGKKRLAYTIQNHKYGTYVLLQFEAETGSFLKDFEMFLKLDKNIIRSQTIRLDEKPKEIVVDETEESKENDDIDSPDEKDDGDEDTDDDIEETGSQDKTTKKPPVEESDESDESEESPVEETEKNEEAEATEEKEASDTSNEEAEEKKEE